MDTKTEETMKDRQIPFSDKLFERVKKSAQEDRRFFKYQAMILIEEALDARDHDAALDDEG